MSQPQLRLYWFDLHCQFQLDMFLVKLDPSGNFLVLTNVYEVPKIEIFGQKHLVERELPSLLLGFNRNIIGPSGVCAPAQQSGHSTRHYLSLSSSGLSARPPRKGCHSIVWAPK